MTDGSKSIVKINFSLCFSKSPVEFSRAFYEFQTSVLVMKDFPVFNPILLDLNSSSSAFGLYLNIQYRFGFWPHMIFQLRT